jgi:4-amino-4-deoxy-L-arabinose transferase-like glycosyltransferase
MVQAWLVLPGLAAAYLLAAPAERWRTRIGHVAAAGAVTALVSLSWITAVSLVPDHDRPYADGSRNNSFYEQVFDYNGLARMAGKPLTSVSGPPAPFLVVLVEKGETLNYAVAAVRPSWHRLLGGPFGRDGGWLLPAAVLSAVLGLRRRSDQGRRDPVRAAVVLWGGWWVVLAAFFSAGTYLNSYYIAALAPAFAALCGVGVSLCGPPPWPAQVRLTVLAACVACVGYGLYLLHGAALVPRWILPAALLAFAATALLMAPGPGQRGRLAVPALACASALVLPASASVGTVARGLGPFDAPFESRQVSAVTQSLAADWTRLTTFMRWIEQQQGRSRIPLGVDTSVMAAPYILVSGREVQPIGGYLGGVPVPTLAAVQSEIRHGDVHLFLLPIQPSDPDPRLLWIEGHCPQVQATNSLATIRYAYFRC